MKIGLFEPFEMERWQSIHEHHVEVNLSDSGVHPLSARELIDDPAELESVLDQRLIYTQTNGTEELRTAIAALYPGSHCSPDQVEVVNGGAEANFIASWTLVEPGDEVVVMMPNYMQIRGIVKSLGATVREWWLKPDFDAGCWRADLEDLTGLVNEKTRMIALCNPNNPTGLRLTAAELDAVGALADRFKAWVLADEIYRDSELDGVQTPTLWGRTDQAVISNSLSKSYGLPGLRLGWLVAQKSMCAKFWARHDYTTIGPGALSDLIACKALTPDRRRGLQERAQQLLNRNYEVVGGWLAEHSEVVRGIKPEAGAMMILEIQPKIPSLELADRLRKEKSLLIVPGAHFEMEGWLRIGFGGEREEVADGLKRLGEMLREL